MSSDSPKSLFAVDGMVALVTGGATGTFPPPSSRYNPINHVLGIGLMLVKALVENGAEKVYIIGRRKEVLEQAQATLGSKVEILVGDVAKKEDLVAAAEVVKSQVGYLNLLICNAGVAGPKVPGPAPGTTVDEWAARNLEIPTEDFTKTFDINTTAAWYTTMAFLTLLDAGNKKGNLIQSSQVITTSSIGAFNKTAPGGWAYGMSKAAVTHLTKMLAIFLPAWNIRVNSIVPGRKCIFSS